MRLREWACLGLMGWIVAGSMAVAEPALRFGLVHTPTGITRIDAGAPSVVALQGFTLSGDDGVAIDLGGAAEGYRARVDFGGGLPEGGALRVAVDTGAGTASDIFLLSNNPLYEGNTVAKENPLFEGKSDTGERRVSVLNGGQVVLTQVGPIRWMAPEAILPRGPVYGVNVGGFDDDATGVYTGVDGGLPFEIRLPAPGTILVPVQGGFTSVVGDAVRIQDIPGFGNQQDAFPREIQISGSGLQQLTLSDAALIAFGGQPVVGTGSGALGASGGAVTVRATGHAAPGRFGAVAGVAGGQGVGASLSLAKDEGGNLLCGSTEHFKEDGNGDPDEVARFHMIAVANNGSEAAAMLEGRDDCRADLYLSNEFFGRPVSQVRIIASLGSQTVAEQTITMDTSEAEYQAVARGIPLDGPIFFGIGVNEPGVDKTAIAAPFVPGGSVASLIFPPGEIEIGGEIVVADRIRAPCLCANSDTYIVEELEFVVERVEKAKGGGEASFTVFGLRGYTAGGIDQDLGLPASNGGLFRVGQSVCFEVPSPIAFNVVWRKDGAVLAGAPDGGRLCIASLRVEDSGTYTATYDDGGKAPQTYSVTITVAESVPAAGLRGLGLLAALIASAGAVGFRGRGTRRRR